MEIRDRIISAYIEQFLEHGAPPQSIHRFCRDLEIQERDFFTHFASFEVVEKAFWEGMINDVIHRVESSEEFASFNAHQRLLTFFFAFNEKSLEVRTMMLSRFRDLGIWCRPVWLKGFEDSYKHFVKRMLDYGRETGEVAGRGRVSEVYPEGFYLIFRSVIDFNMKDDSEGFERTDAYIEKSVKLAMDVVRTQALDSAVDLIRFLVPDMKFRPSGG